MKNYFGDGIVELVLDQHGQAIARMVTTQSIGVTECQILSVENSIWKPVYSEFYKNIQSSECNTVVSCASKRDPRLSLREIQSVIETRGLSRVFSWERKILEIAESSDAIFVGVKSSSRSSANSEPLHSKDLPEQVRRDIVLRNPHQDFCPYLQGFQAEDIGVFWETFMWKFENYCISRDPRNCRGRIVVQ